MGVTRGEKVGRAKLKMWVRHIPPQHRNYLLNVYSRLINGFVTVGNQFARRGTTSPAQVYWGVVGPSQIFWANFKD